MKKINVLLKLSVCIFFVSLGSFLVIKCPKTFAAPEDKKMPETIPCYDSDSSQIIGYGAKCVDSGMGCIPNPCKPPTNTD
jgi:hypothetical protein